MKLVLQIALGVILGQAAWTGLQLLTLTTAISGLSQSTAAPAAERSIEHRTPARALQLPPLPTTTITAKPPCTVTNERGETFACPKTTKAPN